MTTFFIQAFIYLCAAVIAVPLAKRFGLGSVLGYLIAGVIIGPVLGLVGQETETIQHYAEFGVVMMLFLVGLELSPKALWAMRHRLLGLGGLQVSLTTVIVMAIAMQLGQDWTTSLTIGLIFSLSSTAIVLQTFNEKGLANTEGGRTAFSTLLFQDIAVIPMLALIPLMELPHLMDQAKAAGSHIQQFQEELSLVANLTGLQYGMVVVVSVISVVVMGHYLSRPLFRYVAASGLREIFTTTALMLVIGIAGLMSLLGLSPALGTFMAGVVLANSEFRHELESNIEPFKGILLGLFFITVGAGINFSMLAENLEVVALITLTVIVVKVVVVYTLAAIFRVNNSDRWLMALSLAQAGEFGFVLLNYSYQHYVIDQSLNQLLSLVVAMSMFLTPGLFILFDKVILPRFEKKKNQGEADKDIEHGAVIIAGFGRFGQIVNRLLVANGVKTVALDHEAGQVESMRRFYFKSYYGDATKPDLLHTAGIEQSKLIVVAIDDKEGALTMVSYVKKTYPHIKILARAFDRRHMYELKRVGADYIVAETYYSALEMGREALVGMGFHPFHAEQLKNTFVEIELTHKTQLYNEWQANRQTQTFTSYRELFVQLETVLGNAMKKDRNDNNSRSERGWAPPPKNYAAQVCQADSVKNQQEAAEQESANKPNE